FKNLIMSKNSFTRRKFLAGAAAVGAAGAMGVGALSSCTGNKQESSSQVNYDWQPRELKLPPMLDIAPDGPVLKAGVIGCGGRGSGAAINFLSAGPNVTITALGDTF